MQENDAPEKEAHHASVRLPNGDYDCAASACVKKAWGILDDVKKLAGNQQPCYLCGKNERRNREDISIRIFVRGTDD